ncbi:hypothetical protein [Roseivivax sp. CAU 1753]
MLRTLCLTLVLLLPGPLLAGAWPREVGTVFLSSVSYLSWPQRPVGPYTLAPQSRYDTLYVEYGATPRWTIGLDMGRSVSGDAKLVAFVRRPLSRPEAWLKIAGELGLGEIAGRAVIRPGLSLGHGWDGGWFNADLNAERYFDAGETDVKLDMTYGRTVRRHKVMLQLQAGRQAGDDPFLRVVPSVVTPLWRQVELEVGATYGVVGDESMGLKLGVWTQF